jgi:hypothetical protein
LDAGLLVGTEDVVLGAEGLTLPAARIQVQNRAGLLGELRIPWKDPILVPPMLDGVSSQNAPYCAPTDRFTQGFLGPCRQPATTDSAVAWLPRPTRRPRP